MDTPVSYNNIQYLDKKKFVHIWGSKLPHWLQENASNSTL